MRLPKLQCGAVSGKENIFGAAHLYSAMTREGVLLCVCLCAGVCMSQCVASLACMEMLQVVMLMICFLIVSAAPCLPLHGKLNVLHSFGLPLRHPFTDFLCSFPVPSTHLPLVPRLSSFLSSLCLPSLLSSLCFLPATSLFCAHAALPESIRCSDVLRPLRERLQRLSSSRYLSHSLSHSLQPRCVNPHLPTPLVPLSPSGFSLDTYMWTAISSH